MDNHSPDIVALDDPDITIDRSYRLSPETARLKQELKLEIMREKYENTWESCCIKLDKRATLFFSQLSISLLVIVFSLYQLLHSSTCEKDQLYSGILTLILGVYLPQPKMK